VQGCPLLYLVLLPDRSDRHYLLCEAQGMDQALVNPNAVGRPELVSHQVDVLVVDQ
jgi:hypothetical protein